MRSVLLRLAYDGTDFRGWQRQAPPGGGGPGKDAPAQGAPESAGGRRPDGRLPSGQSPGGRRSVQEAVEAALERMHGQPVALAGAGRTDSGVHAAGQAASFRTGITGMDPARFAPALNSLLPPDVRVLEASEASPGFHARLDASHRTYRYRFVCARQALPHEARYALQLWRRPRVALLNAYCRHLIGEIDCSIFAAAGDPSLSRMRHVSRASFFQEGCGLVFEITANAFLWKMVRSAAGTLLRCEEKSAPPEALRDAIASGQRSLAGPTLPARGLFLWKVGYRRI